MWDALNFAPDALSSQCSIAYTGAGSLAFLRSESMYWKPCALWCFWKPQKLVLPMILSWTVIVQHHAVADSGESMISDPVPTWTWKTTGRKEGTFLANLEVWPRMSNICSSDPDPCLSVGHHEYPGALQCASVNIWTQSSIRENRNQFCCRLKFFFLFESRTRVESNRRTVATKWSEIRHEKQSWKRTSGFSPLRSNNDLWFTSNNNNNNLALTSTLPGRFKFTFWHQQ